VNQSVTVIRYMSVVHLPLVQRQKDLESQKLIQVLPVSQVLTHV